MCHTLRLTAIIATALCLFGCQGNDHYEGKRTTEEHQLLIALDDSVQYLTPHALQLIKQKMEDAEDSLEWYDYFLMYGRHFMLTDKPAKLLPYADRTLKFVAGLEEQTPRTRGLAAMAKSSKASYYYLLHQFPDSVLSLYHEAYRLLMVSDIKEKLPDLAANIGDAYVAEGDLAKGSRWYRRALYLNDSLRLPKKETVTLYMGLGRIYTTIEDYQQAKSYYELTEQHFSEMRPNMQTYFLNNYGNYFYFSKNYEKALETFRRMKRHLESNQAERHFDMYLCKINMADVFLNMNMTDSARYYVTEAEQYFKEQNVDVGIYYAQTIRIGIALKEGRAQDVKQILKEANGLEVNDMDMKRIRSHYMNKYYAAIGDYEKAYASLKVTVKMTDSTEYERKSMRSSDIMTRLTEDTIRLHHQLKMNEQEIRYAKIRSTYSVILAILVFIILIFILWFNHERKRKLKNKIDIMTLRMANARQRISPHFVFNVLNSHINKTDDKEAKQLMMIAKLIRANLDITQKKYVTLDEELDFVSQYVAVEQILMGEDFEFKVTVPEHEVLNSIRMPSMLVQILVENAILHGLKNQEGHKTLEIKVDVDDEKTVVCVCDNGPGFDIRHYNSERSRTGLSIIRNTISAINEENKKNKMQFKIRNDNGCHSILIIPKHLKLPQ